MTGFALVLVLSSAMLHATWNLYAKRVAGDATFIWIITWLSALIYAPLAVAIIISAQPVFTPTHVLVVAGNSILHVAYFILLSRGYRTGDLSLVYPLARGTGPMLSTIGAIVLLGEQPTPLALAGAACIGIGVFLLAGDPRKFKQNGASTGVAYALLTGLVIAAYTLWDRQAVAVLLIPPLLYDWLCSVMRGIVLTPYALRHRDQCVHYWRDHRKSALIVATLSPLSYILVLTALTFSPVSTIAPAREISILIGAALGARLLSEGDTWRRLSAASVMVLGVAALALG